MPNVIIVRPLERSFTAFNHPALDDALDIAGLRRGEVDFGTIAEGYSIILYEYGLLKGKDNANAYWRCGKQLFNGNAVIFHTDDEGETIDVPPAVIRHFSSGCSHFAFFTDIAEVETAIAAGAVQRPQSSINGKVLWEWNR